MDFPIDLPSGRTYYPEKLGLLRMMHKYGFVRWQEKPFVLNSGIESHVYIFGRDDMTDNPDLEWEIGEDIVSVLGYYWMPSWNWKKLCLIGIPTAGTAMAQAASMVQASLCGKNRMANSVICHRIMRETQKSHGDKAHQNWVNGKPDPQKHTYITVDNVVTNADSKFKANERLKASGYPVEEMPSFIFVDRQQGGIQRMEKAGYKNIIVAHYLLDITYALGEMKLWPKSAVWQVESEIKAHQFI